jgi:2'-5' RNA ligase
LTETDALRAFLAVPADVAWVESAKELVRRLRPELPAASWTRPESWHLTLHFLGEIPRSEVEHFAAQIAPHAEATPGGDLETSGALIFPPRGPARVLAAGFAKSPLSEELAKLAREAQTISRRSPIHNSQITVHKSFHPHITFARLRRSWPAQAVERYREVADAWHPPAFRARSCVLFQSRLDPAGAVHTPLTNWNFKGSPVESNA